jgi:hypothetical protein
MQQQCLSLLGALDTFTRTGGQLQLQGAGHPISTCFDVPVLSTRSFVTVSDATTGRDLLRLHVTAGSDRHVQWWQDDLGVPGLYGATRVDVKRGSRSIPLALAQCLLHTTLGSLRTKEDVSGTQSLPQVLLSITCATRPKGSLTGSHIGSSVRLASQTRSSSTSRFRVLQHDWLQALECVFESSFGLSCSAHVHLVVDESSAYGTAIVMG